MKTAILIAVLAFTLAGCMSHAQLAQRDDEQCKGYGLQLGTPAYGDCRLRLEGMRAQSYAALANSTTQTTCQTSHGTTTCQSY
jgi:hypothetical protein